MEAKILFDADKLDATGALGIARSLIYKGQVAEPLYLVDGGGRILDGTELDPQPSFLREYNFKLIRLYDRLYTPEAKAIAEKRKTTAQRFYQGLLEEITTEDLKAQLSLE